MKKIKMLANCMYQRKSPKLEHIKFFNDNIAQLLHYMICDTDRMNFDRLIKIVNMNHLHTVKGVNCLKDVYKVWLKISFHSIPIINIVDEKLYILEVKFYGHTKKIYIPLDKLTLQESKLLLQLIMLGLLGATNNEDDTINIRYRKNLFMTKQSRIRLYSIGIYHYKEIVLCKSLYIKLEDYSDQLKKIFKDKLFSIFDKISENLNIL